MNYSDTLEKLSFLRAFEPQAHDDEKWDALLAGYYTWIINNEETIRTALTQAAEIDRGDKVVVDREPDNVLSIKCIENIFKDGWETSDLIKCEKFYKAMIEASEGK